MKVKCPRCHKETIFDSTNSYRPFCSERCATLDLGAWADEEYKVPLEDSPSENRSENEHPSDSSQPKHRVN